jgi:hypothetical protein
MLTVGVLLKLLLDQIIPFFPYEVYEITGIGILVPGIIANTIQRQGFPHTILSSLFVAGLTFFILLGYNTFV